MKKIILTASVAIGAAALSACSSSPTTATTPPPTTTTPPNTSFQSMFGASFLAFFNTDPSTDPKVPTSADVPPIDATANAITN